MARRKSRTSRVQKRSRTSRVSRRGKRSRSSRVQRRGKRSRSSRVQRRGKRSRTSRVQKRSRTSRGGSHNVFEEVNLLVKGAAEEAGVNGDDVRVALAGFRKLDKRLTYPVIKQLLESGKLIISQTQDERVIIHINSGDMMGSYVGPGNFDPNGNERSDRVRRQARINAEST